ncbi:MAG: RluA family pseudouridine synthase [Elusimicrobia bacterium]|nr:RluA family pseudouridine synthase [Elusimicrobiota bacterium]
MPAMVEVPFEVQKDSAGLRVDQYLAKRLARYSRVQIQRLIEDGQVLIRDKVAKASLRVRAGETVVIKYPKVVEEECRFPSLPVLYEDQDLLAVDKPGGVLSHPTDKIVENAATTILKRQFPGVPLFLAHRLDRETSGILLFAKNARSARALGRQFLRHEVRKTYQAIVRGSVAWLHKTVDAPMGREGLGIFVRQKAGAGQAAVTEFTRLRAGESRSLVEARPKTGRLHQIRVHLAMIGHPIVGDKLYTGDGEMYMKTVAGQLTPEDIVQLGAERQLLHAGKMRLKQPTTGEVVEIEAVVPGDFLAHLNVPDKSLAPA